MYEPYMVTRVEAGAAELWRFPSQWKAELFVVNLLLPDLLRILSDAGEDEAYREAVTAYEERAEGQVRYEELHTLWLTHVDTGDEVWTVWAQPAPEPHVAFLDLDTLSLPP